jgi:aromatic-L-amino-acid decarboxylase
VRALMAKNIGLARRLHALVRDHPDFEVLHEPVLSIYSFRFVPHSVVETEEASSSWIDQLNSDIAEEIQRSGLAQLMTTRIRGRIALRMSICSQRTIEDDIDTTFEAIAATGRRLAAARTRLTAQI